MMPAASGSCGPRSLRPRLSPCSTSSRYGSQALADGSGWLVGDPGGDASESVVTSLAGFAVSVFSSQEGVSGLGLAGMAAFAGSGSVVTPLAGFAGDRRPHPPDRRTATPAAFK
jgi:hypothetical protein